MKTTVLRACVATGIVAAALSLGRPMPSALSHHSFAMYDQTVERSMTGRLFRFVIGANHSQFIFDVVGTDGSIAVDDNHEPVRWGVETGSAISLARQGITVESFPIGTIFAVTLNPLRDGRNFGALEGAPIICGMTLPEGGCTEETRKEFVD